MKKIIAAVVSLALVLAMATGCSDSSSSSADTANTASNSQAENSSEAQTTTTTAATTTETTAESATETTPQTTTETTTQTTTETTTSETEQTTIETIESEKLDPAFEKSLTHKMQKTLASKQFAMELNMTYMTMNIPIKCIENGKDSYISMNMAAFGGEDTPTEIYNISGKTYAVNSAAKTYSELDGSNSQSGTVSAENIIPSGGYKFISSKEENGMIIETIEIDNMSAQGTAKKTKTEFYFDKATGLPKKIEAEQNGVKSTITFTKFEIGAKEIKLPDLTGWTKQDAGRGQSVMPFMSNGGGQSGLKNN